MIRHLLLFLAVLLLCSCRSLTSNQQDNQTLLIFAAASLTDAFQEAGVSFTEANPNYEINFNFGGSQQLAQQIAAGAPANVFASADLTQMHEAVEAERVLASDVQILLANELVIVYPAENSAQLATIQDLARPGLRLVMAAEEVPAGQYTMQFLTRAAQHFGTAYSDQVLENVASYELNVRAVLTKVLLGEADAGFVYRSDISPSQADQLAWMPIPDDLSVQAVYYIAPLSEGGETQAARDFVAFILSEDGQQILKQYGFIPLAEADLN